MGPGVGNGTLPVAGGHARLSAGRRYTHVLRHLTCPGGQRGLARLGRPAAPAGPRQRRGWPARLAAALALMLGCSLVLTPAVATVPPAALAPVASGVPALCRFVWNARDSADRRGRAERMSREVLQA